MAIGLFLSTCGLLFACGMANDDWQTYSVAPSASNLSPTQFPGESSIVLEPLFRIGDVDVSTEPALGIILDVGLSADHTLYIVDAARQRVFVFDSEGNYLRSIGSTGPGPGEFLRPVAIAVLDSTFAVYDKKTGRVSIFRNTGRFVRSFQPPAGFVNDVEPGPDGTILLTIYGASSRILQLNGSGEVVGRFVAPPDIDAMLQGYLPHPGATCMQPRGGLVFANSWIYELAFLALENGRMASVHRWESEVLRPRAPVVPGVEPAMEQAAIMGLECGTDTIIFAYLDRRDRRLYYDFMDPAGVPQGRMIFTEGPGQRFPGFAAAFRAGRLISFRTEPYSQLFIYNVTVQ